MGQTSAKLSAQPLEAQELLDQVCTALEHRAGKCGKHAVEVYKQVTALRELSQQWSTRQQQAEQLQGRQVLAVAVALHTLTTHLERCKHKLQQRPLVSLRTLSSRQQAAHVQRVLAAAREALANFTRAFKLALLLSKEPSSLSGSSTQQQQQQQQQQQHVQPISEDPYPELHEEWQRLLLGSETPPEEAAQSTAGSGCGAAAIEAAGCDLSQQPPRKPARSASGSQHTGSHTATADTAAQAAAISQPTNLTAAAGAGDRGETPTEAGDTGAAPGAADQGAGCEGAAALWERSQEGWQDLMQRAWRGEEAAVLACAQELIHGGEFCLQDCDLARQLLRTVMEQQQQPCGDACLWLGQLSERGLGLPASAPDYSDAAAWYGRGAELGHLECAQALAFYYEHGLGLVQDVQAAKEWYLFAAEGGLAAAQNNLGQLILQGNSCSRSDTAEALHWLQAAADQGSAAAQFNLGVCHELGLSGQGRDATAAEELYRQAGTAKAWLRVGSLCLQRRDITSARDAFTAAAEGGCAEALVQLAKLQAGQCGFAGSGLQGIAFELVSSLGSGSSGSSSLGWSANCFKPTTSSSSSSLAMQATAESVLWLYQQAASAGAAEAQHALACSAWGKGQVGEAMQLWHDAAAQGHGAALLHLAAVAEKGLQGVKQDRAAARACYAMAAACGCREGAAHLELLDQDAALKSSYHTLQVAW